jgi:hypothetical protein
MEIIFNGYVNMIKKITFPTFLDVFTINQLPGHTVVFIYFYLSVLTMLKIKPMVTHSTTELYPFSLIWYFNLPKQWWIGSKTVAFILLEINDEQSILKKQILCFFPYWVKDNFILGPKKLSSLNFILRKRRYKLFKCTKKLF